MALNREMLLAGRIIVGMGIGIPNSVPDYRVISKLALHTYLIKHSPLFVGLASMTVPMYIAESAPPDMRGRLVTFNNLFITGGQFAAGLVDGAFSYDKTNGWRYGITNSNFNLLSMLKVITLFWCLFGTVAYLHYFCITQTNYFSFT